MTEPHPSRRPPASSLPRPTVRAIPRPLREFFETEISGGIVLLLAALAALIWANSPVGDTYETFWHIELSIRLGELALTEDLRHWVNDGLMAVFFFVVGLEIKRELTEGDLDSPRKAALPALAALGGMVVPALIYIAVNPSGEAAGGWGIPMATDIAFALGVLALVMPAAPASLKTFLLSLAIVDDIGAIVVIAVFYSGGVGLGWLVAATAVVGVIIGLRLLGVWWIPVYVALGASLWLTVLNSGVHATIAGVVLGLLTPAHAPDRATRGRIPRLPQDEYGKSIPPGEARAAARRVRDATPVLERLEYALHPWSSLVIVPVFALANAGVSLTGAAIADAVSSSVTLGIVAGLVVGKLVGITVFTWVASRLRIGSLPDGVGWGHILGAAGLAGIGFTVSLFIASLGFTSPTLIDQAKVGILSASLMATGVGGIVLRRSASARPSS